MAQRQHPFPYRTRWLSFEALMVLQGKLCGRVSCRQIILYGWIAQSVEQRTENPRVPGSIPGSATKTYLL